MILCDAFCENLMNDIFFLLLNRKLYTRKKNYSYLIDSILIRDVMNHIINLKL